MHLGHIPWLENEDVEMCVACGHEWYACDCLECQCMPGEREDNGDACERCGGEL